MNFAKFTHLVLPLIFGGTDDKNGSRRRTGGLRRRRRSRRKRESIFRGKDWWPSEVAMKAMETESVGVTCGNGGGGWVKN